MTNKYPQISYAIPVCNEHNELERLLTQLNDWVDSHDQIVIQKDHDNVTAEVIEVIDNFKQLCKCEFDVVSFPLRNDFAAFKNHLKSHCRKDYIFQIDADETLGDSLLMDLHVLLYDNADTDLFFLPRINIVTGLTNEYAESQHWQTKHIDFPITKQYNEPIVNFPDRQSRLFKNRPEIKWRNRVHEVITGHKTFIDMAAGLRELDPDQIQSWCLIHVKSFDKQVKQNEKYKTLSLKQYENFV